MPDYPPIGITKLSEFIIDIHKDWSAYRIANIGAPTLDTHVPRARAGDILSERFGMARMPDGAVGQYIRGSGAGLDPAYAIPKLSELSIDIAKDWAGYRIANIGAPTTTGDAYRRGSPILATDIPGLDASKIVSGILHQDRGGLGKSLFTEWIHDFTIYYDIDADRFYMWSPRQDINFYKRYGDRYYTSPITGTPLTTGAPTANVLRAIPLIVSERTTLDRIAINVTSAVSGSYRLGIYKHSNLYPYTLVLDAGTVSVGTTGVKEISIYKTLDTGLYWLVCVGNVAPTIRCFAVASMIPILGLGTDLGTAPGLGWSVSFTYGALPSTFPAGASVITATPIPAIFVRLV